MDSSLLISVITPVYNAEKYIDKTIISVLEQTYSNFEFLLVIDQKSCDQSLNICIAYSQKDQRIKVIQDPKATGAAQNRNIGINHAKGEYICFIDADDLWTKDKLHIQIDFMKASKINFSYTSFVRMTESGTKLSSPAKIPDLLDYKKILKLNSIALHTVMISRTWLGDRRFPSTVHEDFALWLNLLRNGSIAYGINQPLAMYRKVPGSRAHNKIHAAKWRWQILYQYEKLNIFLATYYFIQYAVRALILHYKTKV